MGLPHDALAPTEEATQLNRELAAANPAFLPNLAGALGNLGIRYSEVGRTVHPLGWTIWKGEVFVPTEEELLTGIQG